jgi:hypothetical protein
MTKQKILILLVVGIFVLTGSYILNVDTVYAGSGNNNTIVITVRLKVGTRCGINNATVSCTSISGSQTTNSDGEATFLNVGPGTYTFSASKSGCTLHQEKTVTIEADDGENHYTKTLKMLEGCSCD